MRKFLSFFAAAALLAAAAPATTHAARANDLVMCADFTAVYYLGEDGKRYVFPNENIFFSWYNDFDDVVTISCDDLASFPLGDRVVYQAGTRLVKMPSVATVYVVEDNGMLRAIESEEQAEALFGEDWSDRVDDVSEAFWPSFDVGEPLEDGEVPEGTIMKDAEGNLFRMDDGEAVEIDAVLDTDDEENLEDHAIELEDLEERLGVALALTRVDAEQAIEVLTEILEKLKAVRIDDEDEVEFEDVDEIEDTDSALEDAKDAIDDAKAEIADAEEDLAEDAADGKDVSGAEAYMTSADEHLAAAEAALAAGDYEAAEEHADEAKHDAMWARGKAVESIDEDDDAEDEENVAEDDDDESDSDVDEDTNDDDSEDQEDDEDESDDESDDTSEDESED